MRDEAGAEMKRRLAKELCFCRGFSISMDEKEVYVVAVLSLVTEQWGRVTRLLSFRELPGFTASEIFACLQEMLRELDVPLEKSLGFTADGASVMGSRRAFGLPGSNVAKLL